MNLTNFFAELKRRNVYKVANRLRYRGLAAYAGRESDLSVLRYSQLGGAASCAAVNNRISSGADSRLGV